MDHLRSEGAKWRPSDADDAPAQEAMRERTKPIRRRNPSADQKKVRREMARKTAAGLGNAGDRTCKACGTTAAPVLADTGPACRACGSYSLVRPDGQSGRAIASKEAAGLDNAGDRTCQACGLTASPVLADTGPACRRCGSYSLVRPNGKPGHGLGGAQATHDRTASVSLDEPSVSHPSYDDQTATRTLEDDADFDPYLVTRCSDCGETKVTGDRPSQEIYINAAQQCHNEAAHPDRRRARAHGQAHREEGSDCWSCGDPGLYIASPGERESGRTASLKKRADEEGSGGGDYAEYLEYLDECNRKGWSPMDRDTWRVRHQTGVGQDWKTAANKAPYYIRERGDKYVVVNDDGDVKGTFDTHDEAREQQKALYANVPGASKKAEEKHEGARKVATNFEQSIATSDGRVLLNPGDQIRTPTGQTMTINQIRRHETSRDHYYLDTDAGTSVVPWSTKFQVVPSNQRQQELPGFGTPGGNSNSLPFDPSEPGASNSPEANACPVCGAKGSLQRQGDKFRCSRCGYSETYGVGGKGVAFSDSPQQIRQIRSTRDHRSAIARRAAEVLDQTKETPL